MFSRVELWQIIWIAELGSCFVNAFTIHPPLPITSGQSVLTVSWGNTQGSPSAWRLEFTDTSGSTETAAIPDPSKSKGNVTITLSPGESFESALALYAIDNSDGSTFTTAILNLITSTSPLPSPTSTNDFATTTYGL
ncbi:hypothetical protein VKT23_015328 [Stygiomarasmius scandens]|uniref:Uncharacterized protein n=1 Tax=Marasmiellus scandens TaxID=2682957 RepID=A0ABR1IZF8_9AGAR